MAQPVQQAALRAPGFQGLNTELSPINGDPEFALVADNVVVDQIGRLSSRKAFANFEAIGSLVPLVVDAPVTTGSGIGPDRLAGWSWVDNVITITESNGVMGFIHPTMMDAFEGDPERSTYTLVITIDFKPQSATLNGTATEPVFGDIGRVEFSQGVGIEIVMLDCTSQVNPGFGPDEQDWSYAPVGFPQTIKVELVDPLKPLDIRFRARTADVSAQMPVEITVSIDRLEIDGFSDDSKGFNEIVTLGRDVIGRASAEQEQRDFRPVFIYRWADSYVYPPDVRRLPAGMGKRRASPRTNPELGGTISYAVGTYIQGSSGISDLSLPSAYESEALLTGMFVNFNAEDLTTGDDRLLLFVKGMQFLRLDSDTTFVESGAVWTDAVGTTYPIDGDIAISAYGRVWVTGVGGDYHQIHYSKLLDETTWYDESADFDSFNDAGIIDVREYWPVDGDSIVNIHAHNGFLLVFGRNSILIYANADAGNPAGILGQQESGVFLQDAIANVGLVRRDAICNIGTDVLFVDDTGVRSLGRVVQEKSNPLAEPSINIRRELQEVIASEITADPTQSGIRFKYLPSESIAVLLFASLRVAYAFDCKQPSKTGGMKVTRWTDCFWNDAIEIKQEQADVVFLAGKPAKGLLKYDGYTEGAIDSNPQPYVMRYESMALAMGQSPMQQVIPKSIHYVCMGEYVPGQANALWGFSDKFVGSREFQIEIEGGSEYNVNEFTDDGTEEMAGYYPDGGPYYKGYKINTTGSGELFRVGLEVKVQGGKYGLQEIDINSAIGRLTA